MSNSPLPPDSRAPIHEVGPFEDKAKLSSDAAIETTQIVDPRSVPELEKLKNLIDGEETLSSQQEEIHQLVYAKGVDFFNLQQGNRFPFDTYDNDQKPLDRGSVKERTAQYEVSASILNGIILNSSDDPEEQTANQQALVNVLNRYGSTLHELTFHNGQHSIDTLGLSDLEKKTLGKLIIARTITRINAPTYFNGILNIHKLADENIIEPKDIIEV